MTKLKTILLKKLNLLCALLISINCAFTQAQDTSALVAFANQQFKQKNYHSAIKEYQRAILFGQGLEKESLYYQLAESFFADGDYYNASISYDIAYGLCKNDSLRNEIIFKKAMAYLLDKKYEYAIIELFNLNDTLPPAFERKRNFYLGLSYYGKEDFNTAKEYFVQAVDSSHKEDRQKIDDILSKRKNTHRPNPKLAKLMSYVIPGSGQLYAGDVKNSLNSLLLTGGFAVLMTKVIISYSLVDGLLIVGPWLKRYYQGGIERAETIAEEKRMEKRNTTYKKVLSVIEKSNNAE